MKYSGHRKLLCEFSNSSKLNALLALNAILVYKFRPERIGYNMCALRRVYATVINFPCITTLLSSSYLQNIVKIKIQKNKYVNKKMQYSGFQIECL